MATTININEMIIMNYNHLSKLFELKKKCLEQLQQIDHEIQDTQQIKDRLKTLKKKEEST